MHLPYTLHVLTTRDILTGSHQDEVNDTKSIKTTGHVNGNELAELGLFFLPVKFISGKI